MKKCIGFLLCAVLLFSLCLTGCSQQSAPAAESTVAENGEFILRGEGLTPAAASDNDCRVFYEIFVGSFSDSDGDGIGDLRGIINRMDYLNDGDPDSGLSLGVEGLWLTPIFESPSYHKYDISDFYKIDPAFGTTDDLKELVELCHERGVKLILDLPINHTSSGNLWFIQFKAAHKSGDTSNPYYDFYTWCTADSRPAGRGFAQIPGTSDYYECNFWTEMPELNFDNPAVREAMLDVARTWLELGVDGFRFDAAKYIYYGDHSASVDYWIRYMMDLRDINPDVYTVAEVWDPDGITDLYFPAFNCFNFTVSQVSGLITSAATGGDVGKYAGYVESYLDRVKSLRADATIVPFVANHDTDRAAGFLPISNGSMRMAANLYLLGPGSPFIYYGEEIGMKGTRGSSSTDANRRLAMLWGDGDTVKDPEGTTYDPSKQPNGTVADQLGDGNSLYSYYKALLMIRRANPEIASGDYRAVAFEGSKLGGFTSTLDGSTVCVLHNTTSDPLTVDLSHGTAFSFTEIRAVIGQGSAALEGTMLTLDAQTSVVLK